MHADRLRSCSMRAYALGKVMLYLHTSALRSVFEIGKTNHIARDVAWQDSKRRKKESTALVWINKR